MMMSLQLWRSRFGCAQQPQHLRTRRRGSETVSEQENKSYITFNLLLLNHQYQFCLLCCCCVVNSLVYVHQLAHSVSAAGSVLQPSVSCQLCEAFVQTLSYSEQKNASERHECLRRNAVRCHIFSAVSIKLLLGSVFATVVFYYILHNVALRQLQNEGLDLD